MLHPHTELHIFSTSSFLHSKKKKIKKATLVPVTSKIHGISPWVSVLLYQHLNLSKYFSAKPV